MKQYQVGWMEFEELYDMVFDDMASDEDLALVKLVREQADWLRGQYLQPGSSEKLDIVVQALHELQVCYPAITRALTRAKKQEEQHHKEFLAQLERRRQQAEQSGAAISFWLMSPDKIDDYLGDPNALWHIVEVVDIEGPPLPEQTNGDSDPHSAS